MSPNTENPGTENFGDFSFDDVLQYVESGDTVPVIGPELLTAPASKGGMTLYEALAEPLAKQLNVDLSKVSDPKSLNMIVLQSELFRNKKQVIYRNLKAILDNLINSNTFPLPEPLRKLAEITNFKLYLTTTFDPLLAKAVNQARFHGRENTSVLKYCTTHYDDLPVGWTDNPRETVYHLFGRATPQPDYVVTDDDMLEFIHKLQSGDSRPQRLFDKLHRSNLLLLGVGFPDWLARLFLRVAKNDRLSATRDRVEFMADNGLNQNENLVYFFSQFSRETNIYNGGAVDFVNRLYDRWKEKKASSEEQQPYVIEENEPEPLAAIEEMKTGSVFISYASENREQAKRLRDKLDASGIDVWYDRDKLHAGNYYESKIRNNIKTCSLFLPVISAETMSRDGFFRREWKWAVERAENFFGGQRPFILPIVIDQTPDNHPDLPEQFPFIHGLRAPGGELQADAVTQVLEAVQSVRKRERVNA